MRTTNDTVVQPVPSAADVNVNGIIYTAAWNSS